MNRRIDIGLLFIFESQYFPANFTTKNIRSPCGKTAIHISRGRSKVTYQVLLMHQLMLKTNKLCFKWFRVFETSFLSSNVNITL